MRLWGETFLLILLIAQLVFPALGFTGNVARVAHYIWLATFPGLIAVALANRRQPGMLLLGAGLLLNLIVIVLNGGMPVALQAVQAIKESASVVSVPAQDFVHVAASSATRLVWLSDVIPLDGPSWLRSIASPGDCLLFAGVAVFLAAARTAQPDRKKIES